MNKQEIFILDESAARRAPRISPELAAKVAHSIGGYWATTPDTSWILQRQNDGVERLTQVT